MNQKEKNIKKDLEDVNNVFFGVICIKHHFLQTICLKHKICKEWIFLKKYQKLDIEGAILDEEQLKKHMEKIAIQHTLKQKSDKSTYPIPQMLTNYLLIKST